MMFFSSQIEENKTLRNAFLLGCVGLVSVLFAVTDYGKKLEMLSIDERYKLSKETKLSPEIVLVLMDEQSRAVFGEAPYPRPIFATAIAGMQKMGARVIGLDYTFEERKSPAGDSLLFAAIHTAKDVVTGCFFRKITADSVIQRIVTPGQSADILHYAGFLQSPDSVIVLPCLLEAGSRAGHVNLLVDPLSGIIRSLPLYVVGRQKTQRLPANRDPSPLCAALSLEITKAYYGISNREVKITNGKLVLMPAGREPIRIPINNNAETTINFLGSEETFEYYSFADVYEWCREALSDTTRTAVNPAFLDKIVLIGSLIDDDNFSTPYSVNLAGVLIHATIVDNILREQFITQFSFPVHLAILAIVGVILFVVLNHARPSFQLIGCVLFLASYLGICQLLFNRSRVILPLATITVFVTLSLILQLHQGYISTIKTTGRLEARLRQFTEDMQTMNPARAGISAISSYYRFFIFAIEERDRTIFPQWIERWDAGKSQISPFVNKPGGTVPFQVESNAIRKLNHNLKVIWRSYFDHVRTGQAESSKPGEELRKIGTQIANDFGLRNTFKELFSSGNKTIPINLVLSNLKIPWHYAFDERTKRFLSEEFALGIAFATEKRIVSSDTSSNARPPVAGAATRMALLFYGDWQGHPGKQLRYVQKQINGLQKQFSQQDCTTLVIYEKSHDFLNRLARISSEGDNLRVIHYAGHAAEDSLDVGCEDFVKWGVISETMGLSFPSRPLVFLNACSSGQLQEKGGKMASLSTEFLACGAGACIVTNFDVYEKTAGRFATIFYEYFVHRKLTAGEALKLTIRDLGEPDKNSQYDPDYDITRYFYHLFGDPTVRF